MQNEKECNVASKFGYYNLIRTNDNETYQLNVNCNETCHDCTVYKDIFLTQCMYFENGLNFMLVTLESNETSLCTMGNVPMSENYIHLWTFFGSYDCNYSNVYPAVVQNRGVIDQCQMLQNNGSYSMISKFHNFFEDLSLNLKNLLIWFFVLFCYVLGFWSLWRLFLRKENTHTHTYIYIYIYIYI